MTLYKEHTRQRSSLRQMRQQGFTLIELLVSISLGLVVIGALVVMYTSGSAATRNAQAQGQMNEDAQMALGVVTHELRQAGFNPLRAAGARNDLLQGGWGIFACDTGFVDNTLANVSALTCNAAGTSASLAVVYEGDLSTGKNTAGNLPMDCIGNGVAAAGAGYHVMQSRLYIAGSALTCRGSSDLTQAQVLAENIESMSLLFAVTEPTVPNSKVVLGYLTADQINNPTDVNLLALPLQQRWDKVVAVRVCVVVSSENLVLQDMGGSGTAPSYKDCNDADVDIADRKLRRAYRTTVLLRNHGVGYVDS